MERPIERQMESTRHNIMGIGADERRGRDTMLLMFYEEDAPEVPP